MSSKSNSVKNLQDAEHHGAINLPSLSKFQKLINEATGDEERKDLEKRIKQGMSISHHKFDKKGLERRKSFVSNVEKKVKVALHQKRLAYKNEDDSDDDSFTSQDFELPELELDDGKEQRKAQLQQRKLAELRKERDLKIKQEEEARLFHESELGAMAASKCSFLRVSEILKSPIASTKDKKMEYQTLDDFSQSSMLALKNPPFYPEKMPFRALQELQTCPKLPATSFRYVRDVGIVKTKKMKSRVNAELEFALAKQAVGGKVKSFYNKHSKYGGEKNRLKSYSIVFQSHLDEENSDDDEPSTLDHPGLDSLEEKTEDLRQEFIEKWCISRGKQPATSFINKEKRALRRWFKELDYDGSKEVNVAELQDPLLSSGILKTKEQVKRVLQNVDKNKTMGIDFEEFLLALKGNKLADFSKLQRLQDMNNNEHGFEMTTLLAQERRKRLFKSTVQQSQMRCKQFDEAFKRASFHSNKVSKREREKALQELDNLEEKHLRTASFHNQYIDALKDVLVESRAFMEMQDEYDKEQDEALQVHVEAIQKEGRIATNRSPSPPFSPSSKTRPFFSPLSTPQEGERGGGGEGREGGGGGITIITII